MLRSSLIPDNSSLGRRPLPSRVIRGGGRLRRCQRCPGLRPIARRPSQGALSVAQACPQEGGCGVGESVRRPPHEKGSSKGRRRRLKSGWHGRPRRRRPGSGPTASMPQHFVGVGARVSSRATDGPGSSGDGRLRQHLDRRMQTRAVQRSVGQARRTAPCMTAAPKVGWERLRTLRCAVAAVGWAVGWARPWEERPTEAWEGVCDSQYDDNYNGIYVIILGSACLSRTQIRFVRGSARRWFHWGKDLFVRSLGATVSAQPPKHEPPRSFCPCERSTLGAKHRLLTASGVVSNRDAFGEATIRVNYGEVSNRVPRRRPRTSPQPLVRPRMCVGPARPRTSRGE